MKTTTTTMNNMMNNNNNNNNIGGNAMSTNNNITWKSVKGTNAKAIGAHKRFRAAVINKVFEVKFVINRIDIEYNKQTQQYEETSYLTIVDDSPLIREFGYNEEYKRANVRVMETDDNDKKQALRINIDGVKYVYCDSIIAIQCEETKKINELADKGYNFNNYVYMAATASPSNEKHAVKYYAQINENVPNEEVIFNKIDKLMGYALSYKLTNKNVDGKAITKANTRIGNYASGMQNLAQIDLTKERIAIVKGSIGQAYDFNEETRKAMNAVGIEIDNHINDGAAFITPAKIVEMAKNLGLRMSEDDAMRIAVQTRWDVVNTKVMAQVKREAVLEEMANFYKADIYGNPNGHLVALVDEDGAKMINVKALKDGQTKINMYVMAVANAGGVKSCSQHLIKYMAINPEETLRLVDKYTNITLDNFVVDKAESNFENGFGINNKVIANLPANEVFQDSFLVESIYKEAWVYVKSMIAKNKLPIDGVYTHMTFDLTYSITNGLLDNILGITKEGFIEAYNPDVLRIYAEEIKAIEENDELTEDEKEQQLFNLLSAVVIKFPSAMPDEYEIIVYQTERQMKNKIINKLTALNIENKVKFELKDKLDDYIESAPFGCTIYAPINAMKNKLAGADIDYDATMCDMSEFKFIAINKRLQDGNMGNCTFISYDRIDRKPVVTETITAVDDLDEF